MNDCGQAATQTKVMDEVVAKVPDPEHVILLGEVCRRRGLEFHVCGRSRKTVVVRGASEEIARALEETRRLGIENAVGRLRSLVGVLQGAALRVPPTLLALLDRTKGKLAATNGRSAHDVDGARFAGGKEDAQ